MSEQSVNAINFVSSKVIKLLYINSNSTFLPLPHNSIYRFIILQKYQMKYFYSYDILEIHNNSLSLI
jgi:hypothetical protein